MEKMVPTEEVHCPGPGCSRAAGCCPLSLGGGGGERASPHLSSGRGCVLTEDRTHKGTREHVRGQSGRTEGVQATSSCREGSRVSAQPYTGTRRGWVCNPATRGANNRV